MSDKELIKQEIEKRLSFLWNLIPEGEKVLKDDFTKEDANNLGKYTELESLLKFIDSFSEESASEDLEKAANFYANTHIEWFDSECNPCVMPAFKAGAEWQKQQMMKGTVELTITNTSFIPLPKLDIKAGDKVKIIIVKTEQQ